ncbi:MAG: polyphenol oxidase family protein [Spirochaetes bacterium]|nr:polyphenol oxidase family protein [Spirochaetota bacterium]
MKDSNGFFVLDSPFKELVIQTAGKKTVSIDYSAPREQVRDDEKSLINRTTGIERRNIVFLSQMHGDGIITLGSYPEIDSMTAGEADGLITALPDLCLVIRTADCVPVFLYDPVKKILAAVHSGWRSTRLNITGKAASMLISMGSDPSGIRAFLLPSISGESYSVNEDVAVQFKQDTLIHEGRIYLDLWKNINRSLVDEGLDPDNIYCSGICTLKNNGEFHSYRAGDEGRNLNFGFIKSCTGIKKNTRVKIPD